MTRTFNGNSFLIARNFSQRFGAHRVDFTDNNRTRTAKDSVGILRDIFADNGFLNAAAGGHKKYHDIIERYTDVEATTTTTTTTTTTSTTRNTVSDTTPATGGSGLVNGSFTVNILAVGFIMLCKWV